MFQRGCDNQRKVTQWMPSPSVYSYNDLLAIRTVVRLRAENLPLQQIRKAIEYFYKTISADAWWDLKMVVDQKRDLIVVIPKEQTVATRSLSE